MKPRPLALVIPDSPLYWRVELTSGIWTLRTPSALAAEAMGRLGRALTGTAGGALLAAAEVVAVAWWDPDRELEGRTPEDLVEELHAAGWRPGDVLAVALAIAREWSEWVQIDASAVERASFFGPGRGLGRPASSAPPPATSGTPGGGGA